jgi:probable phosphoglycerate mutase
LTLCLLVRHAAHDLVDRVLVGRGEGVHLSDTGRREAGALCRRLKRFDIAKIQSSPRERAVETAAPVARERGLEIEICLALDELDFGLWTGCTFEGLNRDPRWLRWNRERSRSWPPGGESMQRVQERIVSHLQKLHQIHPSKCIVLVTHAEIIRAAILHVMNLPLEQWSRIEVPLASITRLQMRSRTHGIVSLGGEMVVA